MAVVYANLIAKSLTKNSWFNLGQRDNCTYPFWLLREKFKDCNVHLNTEDLNRNKNIKFELHIDVQQSRESIPSYLFLWEPTSIRPHNASKSLHRQYRKIFTWDDNLVDGCRYLKFYLPVHFDSQITFSKLGWAGRDQLCCVIAGNKTVKKYNPQELYSKRVETIRWFEHHASHAFDLYGTGWDAPPAQPGEFGRVWNKVSRYLYRFLNKKPFSSYRGTVGNKHRTIMLYRFSICYENTSGLDGYITEKIFDCFNAGCVPVYWGAANIEDYIPPSCFIDRRKFPDHESLYSYLTIMTENEYIQYQLAIQKYLASEPAQLFSAENFATTIVNNIGSDLQFQH